MITRSEKFAQYISDWPSDPLCEQTVYKFPNNQGASVIYGPISYGLEVAVIRWDENGDWHLDYTTPVTDNVIGHVEDLDAILDSIVNLKQQ